ncbi:MAG: phosphodiester glycosidase family protein, partial [Candidatus Berkiella sp.]
MLTLSKALLLFIVLSIVKAFACSPHYQVIEKSNHQIHLLEFDPASCKVVSVRANQDSTLKSEVSTLVSLHHAIAGINGGFFHLDNNGVATPAGALKINNEWLGLMHIPRAAIGWGDHNQKALVDRIVTKGQKSQKVEVKPLLDASSTSKKTWQGFPFIVGGTPLLLKNGTAMTNHRSEKTNRSFIEERHARTAFCIKDPHHWLFIVSAHTKAPYRQYTDHIVEGLTIEELTKFLQAQGCKDAINLDGGGSSTLVFEGKVRNTPAGDMDDIFQLFHERPVSDAILLLPH